jgi:uncharacterized alpha-E superfamily protein
LLSRTADSLYWTARYVERADFLARILDAAHRLSALPTSYAGGASAEWESAVASSGSAAGFYERYGDANEETVRDYLVFNPDNPSSIVSCLNTARSNARAVRTALTSETWESLNSAWNELTVADRNMGPEEFSRFLDWVKNVALVFDGSARRTMLRNDAYWFLRLGGGLERADNTARILDVKYHLLLPSTEAIGGGLDYFQWTTILREVSAHTAYRWVYRGSVKPWLVADLLILNRQMPRSLSNCNEVVSRHLDLLGDRYGRRGPSQKLARAMQARLTGLRIEDIFQQGLHEFIHQFLAENAKLGAAINDQYLT